MISPRTSRATSIVVLVLALSGAPFARQTPPAGAPLPVVSAAALIRYVPIAMQAHIEGEVRFRVSTDGERIVAIVATRDNPLFTREAFDNLRTWRFEPHLATQFDVAFVFRLEPQTCDDIEPSTESVRAEFPTRLTIHEAPRTYCSHNTSSTSVMTTGWPDDPFQAIYGVRVVLNPQQQGWGGWPWPSPPKPKRKGPIVEPPRPMRVHLASIVGYPLEARMKGIEGVVRLRVRPDGSITVIEGPSELAEQTLATVRGWTIDPPGSDADELRFNFILTDRDCAGGGPVIETTPHPTVMTIRAKLPAACGG